MLQRIGEAAPLSGCTPAPSAHLWLPVQLLETLVRNVLPLPLPGTLSTPEAAAALTKSAVGWRPPTTQPPRPAQSSLESPYPFLPILTSTVLLCLCLCTWMDGLASLLTHHFVSIPYQFLRSPAHVRIIFRSFCLGFNSTLFSLPSLLGVLHILD